MYMIGMSHRQDSLPTVEVSTRPRTRSELQAVANKRRNLAQVIVKVPHPKSLKGDEMLNFSKFYEDDEFFDTVVTTVYPPSIHQLSYALTGQELMIFELRRPWKNTM